MLRNIRGADVIIAFVSQNYIESYACFLELLTAVNNKKQIVFVSLEQQLHLGDTTDLPNVERGVKNEILNQGANIATNTNNTSNDIMRAMKSAFTSISTLLEQDALSKYDISDAFINFFNDASINRKTINDLGAVKGTIESVSRNVFDTSLAVKPEPVAAYAALAPEPKPVVQQPAPEPKTEPVVQQPAPEPKAEPIVQQPAPEPKMELAAQQTELPKKPKIDLHSKKFKAIIAAAAAVCCLVIGGIIIGANVTRNVFDMPYTYVNIKGEEFESTYTGKWKHNKPNGTGILKRSDGNVYEGEWQDGINVYGTLKTADGRTYEGEFKNGSPDRQGTSTNANGDVYEGEWKDGYQNGQGTFTYADGRVYVGEFKDGNQNGQGTITYADGEVYEGEWKDGKKDGQGTMKWTDGAVYEGEWKDDKRNGQGTFTYPDGTVQSGTWQDGKFIG